MLMKSILQATVFAGLFLIPFLPLYVENSFFFPYITGKNFAFRIIVEIVFAAWVLLALYDKRYRPRFSWILAGFTALLGVMMLANAFGEYPHKSFWSNFERMDGYVTLVHVFLYMVVAGSVLTTKKLWSYFLNTSVGVALLVALVGLGMYYGVLVGSSGARIDSSLGNAAYMAVYMLFHIFFMGWLFIQANATWQRVLYVAMGIIFILALLLTGTRGTFLGFVCGVGVVVAYISIFGRAYPQLRKAAIGACIAVVVLVAGFFAIKDTAFVQNQPALARIANISLQEDLAVRGTIWRMALEGVAQRPVLGWGQSNFNYVFNKQYDPSLYGQESWFDRVHNIVLDWLIAGGVLGLLAYGSILIAALYYLLWMPFFAKEEDMPFSVPERAVLLGLLAGYVVHNLVVFDNIISYIFYGSILALIHAHAGKAIDRVESFAVNQQTIAQFVAPLVFVITAGAVYLINAPGMAASGDIIDALRATSPKVKLEEFQSALARNSFADQEIIEQLAQQTIAVVHSPTVTEEYKEAFVSLTQQELSRMVMQKPGDARLHVFFANFYRNIGDLENARGQAAKARTLSPNKQNIIIEQGVIEIQANNLEAATDFFRTAFELDQTNTQARVLYAALLALTQQTDAMYALLGEEYFEAFAFNDFALSLVTQSGNEELLIQMLQTRIAADPDAAQHRASLSSVYYNLGRIQEAVEVLLEAAEAIPSFAETAQCFVGNIEKGMEPAAGC